MRDMKIPKHQSNGKAGDNNPALFFKKSSFLNGMKDKNVIFTKKVRMGSGKNCFWS